MIILEDRIRGCLFGGSIGDAAGWTIEFADLSTIKRTFGKDGLQRLIPNSKGVYEITDDSQMAYFTIEGVLSTYPNSNVIENIGKAYLRWYLTQNTEMFPSENPLFYTAIEEPSYLLKQQDMWHRRGPGATCLGSLASAEFGTIETPINNSKGCGGVMRSGVIGLFSNFPSFDIFKFGAQSAAITHGHPDGYLPAGFQALLVHSLMLGFDFMDAIDSAMDVLKTYKNHENTEKAIQKAISLSQEGTPTPEKLQTLGEGWVGEECLAIGLYCALVAESFEHGIFLAINHSGDSDSTGKICGEILGTKDGINTIPKKWVDKIEGKYIIEHLSSVMTIFNREEND